MVLYRATEAHFTGILSMLNELRQDKTFCDVVLKVGDKEIHAHRSVLVAGCPYFKSLLLGNFTEAKMREINLSEVTGDIDALEIIINFIYSGEVDIDSNNLGTIVKLSSFFLLESLRNFSAEFMSQSLCLRSCLEYYLYSSEHGIVDVEQSSEVMICSRFHDVLIYEGSTLNLLPDDVNCLVDKGFFEFCSSFSVLLFAMKWVSKGKTNKHLAVVLRLLDMISRAEVKLAISYSDALCLKLHFESLVAAVQQSDTESRNDFLSKVEMAINETMTLKDEERQSSEICGNSSVPSCSKEMIVKAQLKSGSDTELAVVTLSPKTGIVESYKKVKEFGSMRQIEETSSNAGFDVCMYVPRTRSWYYICELEQSGLPDHWEDTVGYDSKFVVLDNCAVFVDNRGDNIDYFSLKTKTWHSPNVHYFDHNFNDIGENSHFQANDVCFVVGRDNQKYIVVRMRLFTDASLDQATEMFFRGYVLGDDGESWDCIFVTQDRIHTNLSDNGGMPEMNARISETSNELIVTHSTLDGGWNVVFVADLNESFPQPVILKCEFIEDQDIFRGIAILEDTERFLIVSNGTKNCNSLVRILYEYKFKSSHLNAVKQPEICITTITKPFMYEDEDSEYPCLCECSTTDGSSIWYIEGDLDIASALTEVQLDEHMNLVTKRHTPPPFACISRAHAGQIKKDLVAGLKPITKFFISEKERNKS